MSRALSKSARHLVNKWAEKIAKKHCLLETPLNGWGLDKWTVGPVSTCISIDVTYFAEMKATRKWLAGLLRAAYKRGASHEKNRA